jgi:hypothetical protein
MGVINRAYEVLTDSAQRQALDTWLERKTLNEGRIWESEEEPSELDLDLDQVVRDVACERCGTLDASIRLATWPAVASFVLVSARPSFGGVQCARCRNRSAVQAIGLTSLLGWWSPQGVVHSLRALHQALTDQPVEPPEENARILRWVGLALTARGEIDEARHALKISLGLFRRRETSSLLRRLGPAAATPLRSLAPRVRFTRWALSIGATAFSLGVAFTAARGLAADQPQTITEPVVTEERPVSADGVPLVEVQHQGQLVRYAQDDVLAVELASAFLALRDRLVAIKRAIDEAALTHRTGQADLQALSGRQAAGHADLDKDIAELTSIQDTRLDAIKEQMRQEEQLNLELRAAWLELGSRHRDDE